jgi:hypothetical protein
VSHSAYAHAHSCASSQCPVGCRITNGRARCILSYLVAAVTR